ncbi:MAG: 3'(2'),5'-bisphosphate nucleotidase CysQ [Chloroflexi bacterium]|nr:3'(2'),5'-bisphosphate nucleotidase CysQ [Chloroflexota bacterium]MDA1145969.1 3'(2'),5'-bisphosphate nucleotidase CysQ [Chloroflexota bacterium]
MTDDYSSMMERLVELAVRAGEEILEVYAQDFEVLSKADESPVTAADERAERVILDGLAEIAPGVPVVAEESVAAGHVPDVSGGRFFLVDPLDGTKQFIERNGQFTVNIALIEDGVPLLGVVHLPALAETYWTDGRGGARRRVGGRAAESIHCRAPEAGGLVVMASRSHRNQETEDYLATLPIKELDASGSSLKFCRVAEGAADLYPRLGRTMEWDVAAGHAVLAAAGGSMTTFDGGVFGYGKPGFENPHFIARGLAAVE